MMEQKSTETIECHGEQVPTWIIDDGEKMIYDRPAAMDYKGGCSLEQLRDDECVTYPGAIYRKEK